MTIAVNVSTQSLLDQISISLVQPYWYQQFTIVCNFVRLGIFPTYFAHLIIT